VWGDLTDGGPEIASKHCASGGLEEISKGARGESLLMGHWTGFHLGWASATIALVCIGLLPRSVVWVFRRTGLSSDMSSQPPPPSAPHPISNADEMTEAFAPGSTPKSGFPTSPHAQPVSARMSQFEVHWRKQFGQGNGKDDASDAVNRWVEFKVTEC
jgi:hypothetical protein